MSRRLRILRASGRPGLRSILRNAAAMTGTAWLEAGLRGVYALAIGAMLGPESYGVWSYVVTVYTFCLSLTVFGMDILVPSRLGRDRAAGAFLANALALRLALLGAAGGGLCFYALVAEAGTDMPVALAIVLPALLARGVAVWARFVFIGLECSAFAFRTAAAMRAVELGLGLALLLHEVRIESLLMLHGAVWTAEALVLLAVVRRLVPLRLRLEYAVLVDLLRQGLVMGLATAFGGWLMAGPLILLRHLEEDLARLGQIGLALQIAMLVVMGVQSVLGAALPVLSRAVLRGDPRVVRYVPVTAAGIFLVFALAAGLAFLFGQPALIWMLGPDFAPAGTHLGWCLLFGGALVLPNGVWQVLALREAQWSGAVAAAAGGATLLFSAPLAFALSGPVGVIHAGILAATVRGAILCVWFLPTPARDRPD